MTDNERKDIVAYRIAKARETYDEVDILVQNNLWNTAINRLYYACYYAITALLIANNLSVNTHAGVRQLFGLHFIKTNKVDRELGRRFSELFDLRQSGDYKDFVDYTEEEVNELLEPAKQLIDAVIKLI